MTNTKKISAEWKSWIVSNLEKGVNRDYIFNTLLENGFSYDTVRKKLGFDLEIKQEIPQNWKDWIEENIAQGKDKDGLFKVLMMNGFSYDSISLEMQHQPSVPIEDLKDPFNCGNHKLNDPHTLDKSISLLAKNTNQIEEKRLSIFYLDSFLDKIECDHLIKLIRENHSPSTLASPDSDRFFRTSSTCNLTQLNDNTVKKIDARICNLVGIKSKLSEPIQGQLYEVGQEFKPHTDLFEDHELEVNGGALGQRSYTVMIYLNSTEEGGETTFPLIDREFYPCEGRAIIWCNLNPDISPNNFSMHHAKQVRKGYKAIITKWFRTGIPVTS